MKPLRILSILFVVLAVMSGMLSYGDNSSEQESTNPSVPQERSNPLAKLAREAPFITKNVHRPCPAPLSEEVIAILKEKKEKGETDHFCYLVEYGLRVHWHYLKYTNLSREIPLESNLMLAEFIRLTELPKYTTAHEAGWLNRQFDNHFNKTGWSSYQIYIWAKEEFHFIPSEDEYPNLWRFEELFKTIDHSDRNGPGGSGVCHYGCV